MILTELPVGGKRRKVLVHFDKNGFVYTLDRATGEVLVAERYVPVNWAKRVNLKTGRPEVDSTKLTGASRGNVTDICPTLEGGKNQQPAAWSPATRLFYVPTNNMCMDYRTSPTTYAAGTPYVGLDAPYHAGEGGHLGAFIAWDPVRSKKVWEIREPYPVWSGALATAGGVVFYGTLDGWFKAADARSGKVLWKFKIGSGVIGNPISFRGTDGKQYVAVYAGFGGDWGLLSGDVRFGRSDRRASAGQLHARYREAYEPGRHRVDVRPVRARETIATAALLGGAFLYPGRARAQQAPPPVRYEQHVDVAGNPPPADSLRNPYAADSSAAEEGGRLFAGFNCAGCHGGGAVGNVGPSLADGRWRYGGSDGVVFHSIF